MNKLLVVIISISILLTLSFPSAFATSYTIADTLTGGDCVALGGTWDNVLKICTVNNLTINSVDTLQINSGITFVIDGILVLSGNLNNDGTIEIHILRILSGGVMSNSITGTINNNGNFDPETGGTLNNFGLINNIQQIDMNGQVTNHPSGTINNLFLFINNQGTFDNLGIFNNEGAIRNVNNAIINNINTINNICTGPLPGIPEQGGTITTFAGAVLNNQGDINSSCDEIIGGEIIPIDQTALLLAGVQSVSMWMIPVVLSGIGIGVFVIKRRS